VKPENNTVRQSKRMTCSQSKPPVVASLKQQPILPVCIEAAMECETSGLVPPKSIIINSSVSAKSRQWLDATLLKEALIDLFTNAAHRSDLHEKIDVAISSAGMHFCRLSVSYIHRKTGNEFQDDRFEMTYYSNYRTREIVAQHQAAMNMMKNGRKVQIELCFS